MKHSLNKEYLDYIHSEEWLTKSSECKENAGFKCQKCGKKRKVLDTHHKTYKNFGKETQEDLICLCRQCHEEEHKLETSHLSKQVVEYILKETPSMKYLRLHFRQKSIYLDTRDMRTIKLLQVSYMMERKGMTFKEKCDELGLF